MKKSLALLLLNFGMAFASGTIARQSNAAGECATSTLEGTLSSLDLKQQTLSVSGRSFKVGADTSFRIPGAVTQDSPLSRVPKDAKIKVLYCTKDGTPVEVKVER